MTTLIALTRMMESYSHLSHPLVCSFCLRRDGIDGENLGLASPRFSDGWD